MSSQIIAHLWQSTLFVVAAWLLTLVLRNNAARVRYWVWFAASIKFLIPFALLTWIGAQFNWKTAPNVAVDSFIGVVQQIAEPIAAPQITMRAPRESTVDWMFVVAIVWGIGAAALLIRWAIIWLHVRKALNQSVVAEIAAPIEVRSTPGLSEPGIFGILRPVLLLPEGIASRLTDVQMQAIVAHELCHVRRRDNCSAAIHMLVEVGFWFHPLVWWIGGKLVEERECACDEAVVELGNEPQAYAEGILKVCQFYMDSKLACVAGVSGANLKRRVEAIMNKRMSKHLNTVKKALIAMCAALAVGAPVALGLLSTSSLSASIAMAKESSSSGDLSIDIAPAEQVSFENFRKDIEPPRRFPELSVRDLIIWSYHVQAKQIVGGPSWIDSTKYHIAFVGPGLKPEGTERLNQDARLTRELLLNRFGFKFHTEVRRAPAYVLALSDAGINAHGLTARSPEEMGLPVEMTRVHGNDFPKIIHGAPVSQFAYRLSKTLDAIVLDHTGLKGDYNFELNGDPTPANLPGLLRSQLGLTLEQRVEPVEMLVIDAVESPNATLARPSDAAGSSTRKATFVASVKPTPHVTTESMRSGEEVRMTGDSFEAVNATLKDLIGSAYGGLPFQISGGPKWIDSARFDVQIKRDTTPAATDGRRNDWVEMRSTLRLLLADRFQLSLRRDRASVLTLVVKDATKLKTSAREGAAIRMSDSSRPRSVSASQFAEVLSKAMSRPVLDRTGLQGTYDFDFSWPDADRGNADAISVALQEQLGLGFSSIGIGSLIVERAELPNEEI